MNTLKKLKDIIEGYATGHNNQPLTDKLIELHKEMCLDSCVGARTAGDTIINRAMDKMFDDPVKQLNEIHKPQVRYNDLNKQIGSSSLKFEI